MADGSQSGGGTNAFLAFLVGGLIVVVAVIGYFMYTGQQAKPAVPDSVQVDVKLPDAPKMPAAN